MARRSPRTEGTESFCGPVGTPSKVWAGWGGSAFASSWGADEAGCGVSMESRFTCALAPRPLARPPPLARPRDPSTPPLVRVSAGNGAGCSTMGCVTGVKSSANRSSSDLTRMDSSTAITSSKRSSCAAPVWANSSEVETSGGGAPGVAGAKVGADADREEVGRSSFVIAGERAGGVGSMSACGGGGGCCCSAAAGTSGFGAHWDCHMLLGIGKSTVA